MFVVLVSLVSNVSVIVGRDLRVYSAGRLIRRLHLRKFWCYRVSCVKQVRYIPNKTMQDIQDIHD